MAFWVCLWGIILITLIKVGWPTLINIAGQNNLDCVKVVRKNLALVCRIVALILIKDVIGAASSSACDFRGLADCSLELRAKRNPSAPIFLFVCYRTWPHIRRKLRHFPSSHTTHCLHWVQHLNSVTSPHWAPLSTLAFPLVPLSLPALFPPATETFLSSFRFCFGRHHVCYASLLPQTWDPSLHPPWSPPCITVDSPRLLCSLPSRACAAQSCNISWGKYRFYLCLRGSSHGPKKESASKANGFQPSQENRV